MLIVAWVMFWLGVCGGIILTMLVCTNHKNIGWWFYEIHMQRWKVQAFLMLPPIDPEREYACEPTYCRTARGANREVRRLIHDFAPQVVRVEKTYEL